MENLLPMKGFTNGQRIYLIVAPHLTDQVYTFVMSFKADSQVKFVNVSRKDFFVQGTSPTSKSEEIYSFLSVLCQLRNNITAR